MHTSKQKQDFFIKFLLNEKMLSSIQFPDDVSRMVTEHNITQMI